MRTCQLAALIRAPYPHEAITEEDQPSDQRRDGLAPVSVPMFLTP